MQQLEMYLAKNISRIREWFTWRVVTLKAKSLNFIMKQKTYWGNIYLSVVHEISKSYLFCCLLWYLSWLVLSNFVEQTIPSCWLIKNETWYIWSTFSVDVLDILFMPLSSQSAALCVCRHACVAGGFITLTDWSSFISNHKPSIVKVSLWHNKLLLLIYDLKYFDWVSDNLIWLIYLILNTYI